MGSKIDWIKRFLATLIGFIIFGIAGILLKIILYPYTKNYPNNDLRIQLQGRRIVGKSWRFFVKFLIFSGVLEVKYQGFERLGRAGQLVLANHPSLLDVLLIFSKEFGLNCIVKQALMKNPVMTSPIKACGFLLNTESEALLESAHKVLEQQALLVFPEGTRTDWDGVIKFHRGAVSIGLRSAKIITPVVIKMRPLGFKKGQPWYKISSHKICYEITVGEDIEPKEWLKSKPLPIASRLLNEYLENYFNLHTHTKD